MSKGTLFNHDFLVCHESEHYTSDIYHSECSLSFTALWEPSWVPVMRLQKADFSGYTLI